MRILWQIISNPFKWSWRLLNFIREFIINIFFIIFIIIILWIYLQVGHIQLSPKKGALVIDLAGTIVDKPVINNKFHQLSRELFGASSKRLQENSLFDLVNKLRQAKNDTNITGIVLSLKDFSGSDQASLQYIGKALREFRDSGKPIYAIGDNYNQAQYFLASYASKIYLAPQGAVDLSGIAVNNLYYKTLLDKLKINSHVFHVGTYKSAVEPFLRDDMSGNVREDNTRWVGKLWQHYLTIVAANRKIIPQQLFPGATAILNHLHNVNGDTAKFALDNKLVDEIASRPAIDDMLIKIFGWNKNQKTFNGISIYNYQPAVPLQHGDQIAVIFANGAIIDGSEIKGSVGGDTTADQIRNARLDHNVKAIIFRVNSPGGSVTASEIIRSELAAARTAGKPVIVSMGGVAASGGYWVSIPANYIIASASTLTGSIGIFGIINTIESSLDAIGVHTDGIATSPLADVSITKNLPSEFSQMMHLNVKNGYYNFINLVARYRHKTLEEVNNISQGHVWIGIDAVQNGLVDQLGDFDDAIIKAVELAKLKKYHLNWYLNEPSLLDIFMQTGMLMHKIILKLIQFWLPVPIDQVVEELKTDNHLRFKWNDPKNCYALCISCEHLLK